MSILIFIQYTKFNIVFEAMNPFIDPEISRDHFPDFEAGLKEVCYNSEEEEEEDDGPLEWSIDTLAHMAAIDGQGGEYPPGERVSFINIRC